MSSIKMTISTVISPPLPPFVPLGYTLIGKVGLVNMPFDMCHLGPSKGSLFTSNVHLVIHDNTKCGMNLDKY